MTSLNKKDENANEMFTYGEKLNKNLKEKEISNTNVEDLKQQIQLEKENLLSAEDKNISDIKKVEDCFEDIKKYNWQ